MTFFQSRGLNFRISTKNLLRTELFIGFLVVNFFAIALSEFGFKGYTKEYGFIVSAFYLAWLIISFGFNFSNEVLKKGILILYTSSLFVVLKIAFDYQYSDRQFLAFLFIYTFFCFSQDNLKAYIQISGALFIAMIGSTFFLDYIQISYWLLVFSYFLIFLTGLAIVFSRSFLKEKLVKRKQLLQDIFNVADEGLVLFEMNKGILRDHNLKFKELFEGQDQKPQIGQKFELIRLNEKHLFKNVDFDRAESHELKDGRIINIKYKKVEFDQTMMALGVIKSYKNREEINRSYEIDKLLSLSEESYKYLFEESSSLICILNQEGVLIDVNKTTTHLTGYTKEELCGLPYSCLDFVNYDREEREKVNQKAWQGDRQIIEKAIRTKEGERIDLEIIIQKGKYFGEDALICNSRNINERKALEQELIRNYDKFIALFELSPVGIMVSDIDGNIIDFNSSFLNLFNYEKEAASELNIKDITHPEDLQKYHNSRKNILDGKRVSEEVKLRFISSDDKELIILLNIVLQNDPRGDQLFLISQFIDITDIIQVQKQVEESERSYRALFNNSHDLLYLIDENNHFLDINQAVLDKYGYEKEELMALNPMVLGAPGKNDFESMQKKAEHAMKTGESVTILFWSKKKNGEIFPKEMSMKKIAYRAKDILMITGRDVSQSYHYQEELEKKEKRYRDLFERNLAGVYRTDKQGRILECNYAFAKMFGFKDPTEVKSLINAKEFYEKKEDREELLKMLINSDHVEAHQVVLKKKNGELITVLINVSRIKSDDEEYFEGNLIDISELSRAQDEIRNSQKKYQDLIDNSAFGILIFDFEGNCQFSNPKAGKILEVDSEAELIGKKLLELAPNKNQDYFKSLMNKEKLEELEGELEELELIRSNKDSIDVEITPSLVQFEGNASLQLSFIDISDRKKAERAQEKAKVAETFNKILQAELEEKEKAQKKLIDAQSYMEGIIESSLDMIFTTDMEGKINKVNSAAKKELRVEENQVLNRPLQVIFNNSADAARVFEELQKQNSFSGEITLKRFDQSTFPSYFSLTYLYNAEGVRLGIMGVSRDISDIKTKEIEINQQAAKLNAIIESSSHFFFTLNRNFEVTSYNHVFEKDLRENMGFEIQEKCNFFDIVEQLEHEEPEEIRQFWKHKFETVFKGNSINFEIERKDINGRIYYRDFYLNPIDLDSDQVEEISGIGHDVTEKKISEQNLKSSLQEKDILLKEVHHRVKNNLQVISSILSLQSSYVNDKKILEILQESQSRIKSMAIIHERLYRTKDFSQLKFSEYVKNLTDSLITTYHTKDYQVKIDYQIDEVFLNLDEAIPCGLILNELISNSLKYAFKGRKEGTISIGLKETDNEKVELLVSDDGVGISEALNVEETETLGLQLVFTLTEQLEGKIELIRSNGSTFKLTFTKRK